MVWRAYGRSRTDADSSIRACEATERLPTASSSPSRSDVLPGNPATTPVRETACEPPNGLAKVQHQTSANLFIGREKQSTPEVIFTEGRNAAFLAAHS